MIFSLVSGRPPSSPPAASSRFIVGIETPDASPIASCDQPNNSRAALICLIDTFGIGNGNLLVFDTVRAERKAARRKCSKALAPILDIIRKNVVHASLKAVDASWECQA
jgi:hypothetical protein